MKDFFEMFKDKVTEWFSGLTEPQQSDIVNGLEHTLEEDETCEDYIENEDAGFLYENLQPMIERNCWEGYGWNKRDAVKEILTEVAEQYDFTEDFVDDMAYHMEGYTDPKGFFQDLQYGGCQSGMVGMFIYHSDCKDFYVNHIDDLENFKRDLEDELGEPIRNTDDQPHYTFICWLAYEEFANKIARQLFPNDF